MHTASQKSAFQKARRIRRVGRWSPGLFTLVVALSINPVLHGQARPDTVPPDSVVPLEGVVVSTVRAASTTGGASAIEVTPDSLHVVPAPSLEQVLRNLPFVTVRANSRGEAEITVRGSESRQVAVLVDGVPLTLGWDHRSDPSIIPVTGAERITLVRGLHSVLYGPNVLGGVVEVGVLPSDGEPGGRPAYRLSAGADEHGGRSVEIRGGGAHRFVPGDLTYRAGGGYRARPGWALPRSVTDPYTRHEDLRANSDLEHLDAFGAARYRSVSGAWVSTTASGYRATRGVAPELHVVQPRLWRTPEAWRTLAVLSGGSGHRATRWGTGDVEGSLGVSLGRTEIQSFADASYDRVERTETGDDRTMTLRLLGDHSLGAGATLTGAATYADVHHRETVGEAENIYRQRLWSLASEASAPLTATARVSGGLAMDGADTPESGDKPPLGVLRAWGGRLGFSTVVVRQRVRAHAALSRRARFPSLRELYSGALGRFEPNPALRPETLLGTEAGITAGTGPLQAQAVVYHHRLRGAIARAAVEGGRFRRENRDEIRSTGLELLGELRYRPLHLAADLTLQRVRVSDADAPGGTGPAEYQPRVRAGGTARVALPLEVRAIAAARYTGAQSCLDPEADAYVQLRASGTMDLGIQRSWRVGGAAVRTSLFADNATDAAVYDQCGLPRPGRTLRIAVELG